MSTINWNQNDLDSFTDCLYPNTPNVIGEYFEVGWGFKIGAALNWVDSRLFQNNVLPWPKGINPLDNPSWPPDNNCDLLPCAESGYDPSNFNTPSVPYYHGDGYLIGCPKIKFSKGLQLENWGGRAKGLRTGPGFQEWTENVTIKYKVSGCLFTRLLVGFGFGGGGGVDPSSFSPSFIENEPFFNYNWRDCSIRAEWERFLALSRTSYSTFLRLGSLTESISEVPLFESCPVRNVDTSITIKGPDLRKKYFPSLWVDTWRPWVRPRYINYWALMIPDIHAAGRLSPTGLVPYYGDFEITFENSPDVVVRGILSGNLGDKPYRRSWYSYDVYQDHVAACSCSGFSGNGLPDSEVCPPIRNYAWPPSSSSSSSFDPNLGDCKDITELKLRWCVKNPSLLAQSAAELCVSPGPPGSDADYQIGACLDSCNFVKEAATNPSLICCPKTDLNGNVTGFHDPGSLKTVASLNCKKIYYYCPLTEQEINTYYEDGGFFDTCCKDCPTSEEIEPLDECYWRVVGNNEDCCSAWSPNCEESLTLCRGGGDTSGGSGTNFANAVLAEDYFIDLLKEFENEHDDQK
jgi:hypothetical protein